MKKFDFVADKTANTLTIRREFAADRALVWEAHTTAELLDQWFAPRPFSAKTKTMDFRPGGHWLYAMVDPEGTEFWARMDYETIRSIENYTGFDGFCDENGTLNPDLPRAKWDASFRDAGQNTLVETIVSYQSLDDLETVLQMGMKEGLEATLERLDELILALKK